MKFFTKNELVGVSIILFFIAIFSLANFRIALRRARDSERRVDLGNIYNGLNAYQRDFGFFPHASSDGKIRACKPDNYQELITQASLDEQFNYQLYLGGLEPCEWGADSLRDLADETHPAYLETIFQDPQQEKGVSYYYLASSNRFQIYAYLEGKGDEIGFDEAIIGRNLPCGEEICNFGRAFASTPLDKSIQEYENELLENK